MQYIPGTALCQVRPGDGPPGYVPPSLSPGREDYRAPGEQWVVRRSEQGWTDTGDGVQGWDKFGTIYTSWNSFALVFGLFHIFSLTSFISISVSPMVT